MFQEKKLKKNEKFSIRKPSACEFVINHLFFFNCTNVYAANSSTNREIWSNRTLSIA